MDSPHSSATSDAMPVYQTLLPFFPLQFSEGAWYGGSGDETKSCLLACLYMHAYTSCRHRRNPPSINPGYGPVYTHLWPNTHAVPTKFLERFYQLMDTENSGFCAKRKSDVICLLARAHQIAWLHALVIFSPSLSFFSRPFLLAVQRLVFCKLTIVPLLTILVLTLLFYWK